MNESEHVKNLIILTYIFYNNIEGVNKGNLYYQQSYIEDQLSSYCHNRSCGECSFKIKNSSRCYSVFLHNYWIKYKENL